MSVSVVNGIYRTEFVSIPRSGHHCIVDRLKLVFGEALNFCECYETPEKILDRDPTTNLQKNHDFDLLTPVRDDRQYIVGIRDPAECLVSWFKLPTTDVPKETADDWRRFAFAKIGYWADFYRKWVLSPVPTRRLVVNYADLLKIPEITLFEVASFLSVEPVPLQKVIDAVKEMPVTVLSDHRGFLNK